MKKKVRETIAAFVRVIVILLFIFCLFLTHEIAAVLARIIPLPIVIGGVFGFGFGWLVYEKKIF
jgi:hypothetical protein